MTSTLFALWLGVALADDPAPPPVVEPPAPPAIAVGPVLNVAQKEIIGVGTLELAPCVAVAASAPAQPARATAGAVELRVTLKRGQVRLVTATTVDPGLEWVAPCLERQLAAHAWPLDRGVLKVPITLGAPGEQDRGTAP